ncbi:hypothetical protein [Hyphomicrobium sp. DY-1]|uniref:hypothetical protein n=1 Tax=Hyphomicrobium sp. DY-1 TaxID=3075650 RepID=UPI0039C0B24D
MIYLWKRLCRRIVRDGTADQFTRLQMQVNSLQASLPKTIVSTVQDAQKRNLV